MASEAKRSGAPAWLVIGIKQGSKQSPGPGTRALVPHVDGINTSVRRLVLISRTKYTLFHNYNLHFVGLNPKQVLVSMMFDVDTKTKIEIDTSHHKSLVPATRQLIIGQKMSENSITYVYFIPYRS